MTNQEIVTELLGKTETELVDITNLFAEQFISTKPETEHDSLESALSAEGVEVSGICSRKKAPPPPQA